MKCEATTTKKAWRNPLAPMARCEREAVTTVRSGCREFHMCRQHANRAIGYGAEEVKP